MSRVKKKICFLHMGKTKQQISCTLIMQLTSAFVFDALIIQLLFFLNLKFQVSSPVPWSYSLVCVRPDCKPQTGFLTTAPIYIMDS